MQCINNLKLKETTSQIFQELKNFNKWMRSSFIRFGTAPTENKHEKLANHFLSKLLFER